MANRFKSINIKECNDARLLYLYLFLNEGKDLDYVSNKILEIGDLLYIRLLLRTFTIDNYNKYIDYILNNSDDARYIYYILYDVDYLDDNTRVRLLNRLIELNDSHYIIKGTYYYFGVLKESNEDIFNKIKVLLEDYLKIEINIDNLIDSLDGIIYKDDYEYDYEGFSPNCYKGRNNYVPNMIVCHINNTYGSALKVFYDKESEVSAHYVIRRDGHIKQVVSLDDSAWANGTSLNEESNVYYEFAKSPLIRSIKDNANYYTFSIEHESFDGSLTDEQLKSSVKVMREIISYLKEKYNYDFIIDRDHIIGHSDVNPVVRNKCPGKKFPYDTIIKELKGVE